MIKIKKIELSPNTSPLWVGMRIQYKKPCTHVCKCKNDNLLKLLQESGGMERGGRMVEEVNSCIIYLIHCKYLCKYHNVPPPITTTKEKKSLNALGIRF
jgi:hypothetical protein